ncbi:hypothetical protein B296_00011896 [Ensete ventricosum]|uniref:Uncharacterized protein n=1 Tax=Ensete ventricosum TaxID=4639 RepID=A0A426ZLI7_ENSVE|nr:hypothetical protein B296_00011896 [Ensete ventricosum]
MFVSLQLLTVTTFACHDRRCTSLHNQCYNQCFSRKRLPMTSVCHDLAARDHISCMSLLFFLFLLWRFLFLPPPPSLPLILFSSSSKHWYLSIYHVVYQPRFAIPVHTDVSRFGRYGTGGLHTGKPSDRYVPPISGGTGRYGKPWNQLPTSIYQSGHELVHYPSDFEWSNLV